MNKESGLESSTTLRLLEELDQVLDQSSVMREILQRYQQLYDLESITGPSLKTTSMRRDIEHMEQCLRDGRVADVSDAPQFYAASCSPF